LLQKEPLSEKNSERLVEELPALKVKARGGKTKTPPALSKKGKGERYRHSCQKWHKVDKKTHKTGGGKERSILAHGPAKRETEGKPSKKAKVGQTMTGTKKENRDSLGRSERESWPKARKRRNRKKKEGE